MIKAIKFVSIPVRDQDQAVTFYTEKLGFPDFDGSSIRRKATLDRVTRSGE